MCRVILIIHIGPSIGHISIDKLLSIYCHCLLSDYRFHWLIMPDHTGQMLRHFSTELSSFNCLAFVLQIQWLFWWRQYTRDIVPQLSLPVDSLCTTRPQCQRVCIWSHRGWYGNLSVVNFLAKLLVSVWIGTNHCKWDRDTFLWEVSNRQTDGQTDRQTDRQTERQTEKQLENSLFLSTIKIKVWLVASCGVMQRTW